MSNKSINENAPLFHLKAGLSQFYKEATEKYKANQSARLEIKAFDLKAEALLLSAYQQQMSIEYTRDRLINLAEKTFSRRFNLKSILINILFGVVTLGIGFIIKKSVTGHGLFASETTARTVRLKDIFYDQMISAKHKKPCEPSISPILPESNQPKENARAIQRSGIFHKQCDLLQKKVAATIVDIDASLSNIKIECDQYELHLQKISELKDALKVANHLALTASKIGGYNYETITTYLRHPFNPLLIFPETKQIQVPYYVPDENWRIQESSRARLLAKELQEESKKYEDPPCTYQYKQALISLKSVCTDLFHGLSNESFQKYQQVRQSLESIKMGLLDTEQSHLQARKGVA
jgi:hypothetical protein